MNLRAILEHLDLQKDSLIDIRDIYNRKHDDDELDEFHKRHEENKFTGFQSNGNNNRGGRGGRRGKRGYDNHGNRPQYMAKKASNDDEVYLEDVCLTKYTHMPHLYILTKKINCK
jgi:hypothetical protein